MSLRPFVRPVADRPSRPPGRIASATAVGLTLAIAATPFAATAASTAWSWIGGMAGAEASFTELGNWLDPATGLPPTILSDLTDGRWMLGPGAAGRTLEVSGSTPRGNAILVQSDAFALTGGAITLGPYYDPPSVSVVRNTLVEVGTNAALRIANPLVFAAGTWTSPVTGTRLTFTEAVVSAAAGASLVFEGPVTAVELSRLDLYAASGAEIRLNDRLTASGQVLFDGPGQLTFAGPRGGVLGATSIRSTGAIVIDRGDAATRSSVGAATRVVLDASAGTAASVRMVGAAGASTAEQAGVLETVTRTGESVSVRIDAANPGDAARPTTSLTFAQLVTGAGIVHVGTNGLLGGAERILFSTAPSTGPGGLVERVIVNRREFATYDPTTGLRAATTATSLQGVSATDHVLLRGSHAMPGDTSVASLALDGVDVSGTGTLAIASGAVLVNGRSTVAPVVDFGANRGWVFAGGPDASVTFAGGIAGSAGLLFDANRGTLAIGAPSTLSGEVRVTGGTLALQADNALPAGNLALAGRNGGTQSARLELGGTTQSVLTLETPDTGTVIRGRPTATDRTSVTLGAGTVRARDRISVVGTTSDARLEVTSSTGELKAVDSDLRAATSSAGTSSFDNVTATAAVSSAGSMTAIDSRFDGTVTSDRSLSARSSRFNGPLQLEGTASFSLSTIAGDLSGGAAISGYDSRFSGTLGTTGSIYLSGATLGAASTVTESRSITVGAGGLVLEYTGSSPAARFRQDATLRLDNGTLRTSVLSATEYRPYVGALSVSGFGRLVVGQTGFGTGQLSAGPGDWLIVDRRSYWGAQGGPVTINNTSQIRATTAEVVPNLLIIRDINPLPGSSLAGSLPVWASQRNDGNGIVAADPAAITARDLSGVNDPSRYVRLTFDGTDDSPATGLNTVMRSSASVGGVTFDSHTPISGTGVTLTTANGIVFLRNVWVSGNQPDGRSLSVDTVRFSGPSILSNAGTNVISSRLVGNAVDKLGDGTIVLTGTTALDAGRSLTVREGTLALQGGQVQNTVRVLAPGRFEVRGTGSVINGDIEGTTTVTGSLQYASGYRAGGFSVEGAGHLSLAGQAASLSTTGSATALVGPSGRASALYVGQGTSVQVAGRVGVPGSNNRYVSIADGGTLNVMDGGTVAGTYVNGTLSITGASGTVRFSDSATCTGTCVSNTYNGGTIRNQGGTAVIVAQTTLAGRGTFLQQVSGSLTVDGTLENDLIVEAGGVVDGTGLITGDVTVAGLLRPTQSLTSPFKITGDLSLGLGAELELDAGAGTFTSLIVQGHTVFRQGSRIVFRNLTGADPAQTLRTLLTLGAIDSGALLQPDLLYADPNGNVYTFARDFEVAAVPEPHEIAFIATGLLLGALRVRRLARRTVAA